MTATRVLSCVRVIAEGYRCIRVFSVMDSPVAKLVQEGTALEFDATFQLDDRYGTVDPEMEWQAADPQYRRDALTRAVRAFSIRAKGRSRASGHVAFCHFFARQPHQYVPPRSVCSSNPNRSARIGQIDGP